MSENLSQVTIIKLSSGEEIIADVSVFAGGAVAKNPCVIQIVDAGTKRNNGKFTLRFAKYAPFAKDATIHITDYVWLASPMVEIEEQYKESFSSIILPENKIIV